MTQTIEIPTDRRVRFDFKVPYEIPVGKARFEYKVIPFVNKEEKPESSTEQAIESVASEMRGSPLAPSLKCLVGVKTPRSNRLLGAAANLGDTTLEELRDEWLAEKYLK